MHGSKPPRKKNSPSCSEKHRTVSISILGKGGGSVGPKPLLRRGPPIPNLNRYRWHHPLPSPERDAELVRLAKAGDKRASAELVRNYHRLVIKWAGKHGVGYLGRKKHNGTLKEHTNGATDDAIGRGFEALWRAVLTYDESKGPFSPYAERCIRGQISKEVIAFVKRGSVGETRIERWLFSHPHATPEQLCAAFKGLDVWEAEIEIRQFKARCSWHSLPESNQDDDEPRLRNRNRNHGKPQE